jgi:hypothetical protein
VRNIIDIMTTNKDKRMWRSKLGNNYAHDVMQKNETKLLKQLYQIRDNTPENRLCADCGMRGTVWASVNLGVFLCMTCGAHHRSLGTHISKPKGCTGTYWWGPDELEQMRSIGNVNARALYGAAQPPTGITNADAVAWKEFLMDKYVHRTFAAPEVRQPPPANSKQEQHDFFMNESGNDIDHNDKKKGHDGDYFFSFPGPPAATTSKEIDLISFDDQNVSPSSASKPSPPVWSSKQPISSKNPADSNDFFTQFGL